VKRSASSDFTGFIKSSWKAKPAEKKVPSKFYIIYKPQASRSQYCSPRYHFLLDEKNTQKTM
jgi:hypothetical protein